MDINEVIKQIPFWNNLVDEESELSQEFGVMSIPTIVLVKDRKVVKQTVGARPKAEVEVMLQ